MEQVLISGKPLSYFLKNLSKLREVESADLERSSEQYPYNAHLHLLLAIKNHLDQGMIDNDKLEKAALYLSDRTKLAEWVNKLSGYRVAEQVARDDEEFPPEQDFPEESVIAVDNDLEDSTIEDEASTPYDRDEELEEIWQDRESVETDLEVVSEEYEPEFETPSIHEYIESADYDSISPSVESDSVPAELEEEAIKEEEEELEEEEEPVVQELKEEDEPVVQEPEEEDEPVAQELKEEEEPVVQELEEEDEPVAQELEEEDEPVAQELEEEDEPVVQELEEEEEEEEEEEIELVLEDFDRSLHVDVPDDVETQETPVPEAQIERGQLIEDKKRKKKKKEKKKRQKKHTAKRLKKVLDLQHKDEDIIGESGQLSADPGLSPFIRWLTALGETPSEGYHDLEVEMRMKQEDEQKAIGEGEHQDHKKSKKKKKKSKKKKKKKKAASYAENEAIVSETLADLLASQGYTQKAIDMYEKLCLIIPEKSTLFAQKIEALESKDK